MITKNHRLGFINNRSLLSPSSRGRKSEIKVWAGLVSSEGCEGESAYNRKIEEFSKIVKSLAFPSCIFTCHLLLHKLLPFSNDFPDLSLPPTSHPLHAPSPRAIALQPGRLSEDNYRPRTPEHSILWGRWETRSGGWRLTL